MVGRYCVLGLDGQVRWLGGIAFWGLDGEVAAWWVVGWLQPQGWEEGGGGLEDEEGVYWLAGWLGGKVVGWWLGGWVVG